MGAQLYKNLCILFNSTLFPLHLHSNTQNCEFNKYFSQTSNSIDKILPDCRIHLAAKLFERLRLFVSKNSHSVKFYEISIYQGMIFGIYAVYNKYEMTNIGKLRKISSINTRAPLTWRQTVPTTAVT